MFLIYLVVEEVWRRNRPI